ncbi:MAG: hypothetical protein GX572_01460, partial [Clostridia bacterium]|nr:hypothetical protein [Clostridia bacterium]
MFSERLTHIMELTHTKASELALAANLNASHVSRLRNGSRPLPKKPDFLPAMSAYLARRVRSDYQRNAICRELKLAAWPTDEKEIAALLERWLRGGPKQPADIEPFVRSFSNAGGYAAISTHAVEGEPAAAKRYYYGPQGKQEAVIQFFDRIKKEKSPQTLLLSSEEDMGWIYDNPSFAARWAADFTQVLRMGNRVKIIHHVNRDLNELLEAVAKWVPLYMTGMIEPYFYPRIRDGIFRRTLFLAPQSAAVVSASIGRDSAGMLNELITNPEAIAALVREYENYFALCRPLMKIILRQNVAELWNNLKLFLQADGDLICMAGAPTLATMPWQVAKSMQGRAPASRILELWEICHCALLRSLNTYRYTDILSAAEASAIPPRLPCADFLGAPQLYYTQ